jgi:crotonobetainyl-CoA:carnitine CoA-transferase CaiB-like acyl-CoA transferase
MVRLGLGYDACKALRSDIIFCSVSGYGQTGPLRDYPAIDNIVQATSGLMSLSGEPDSPPVRVGFPAVDSWTGMTAAYAIVTALLRRARSGEGAFIDVAMFDATLAFMTSAATPYLVTGQMMARTGNTGYSAQPTAGMFVAGDGALISLGVVQPNQYQTLCNVLGRPDLVTDERFTTPDLRKKNENALRAILTEIFSKQSGEHWEHTLSAAGAPCGVVRDVATATAMPHLAERGALLPLHVEGLPDRTDVHAVNAGFRMNEDGPSVDVPPPRHGEHTRAVLADLGYGESEIAALLASGAAVGLKA